MTLIDKAEALLPCPFCGEKPRLYVDRGCEIACVNGKCGAEPTVWQGTEAEAIAAWNRRAALPKVKPLVWEPSAINKPWHSAKAPWGWYYAQWDDETQAWFASLEMGEVEAPIILSPSDVPSIDAVKAAAQADYEARILAALEPAPTAAGDREAALREAAAMVETGAMHGGDDTQTLLDVRDAILALIDGKPHEQRE